MKKTTTATTNTTIKSFIVRNKTPWASRIIQNWKCPSVNHGRFIHSSINTQSYTKIRFKELYFSPDDFFDLHKFTNKLTENLVLSSRYALMFRVCYGDTSVYRMLGKQYGLAITDYTQNTQVLSNLHNLLVTRLALSMDEYNYIETSISTIQIIAYEVKYTDQVTKLYTNRFNIDNLEFNRDLIDVPKNHINLVDYKILPLSMDLNIYEKPLNLVIDEDTNTVKHVILKNGDDFINNVNLTRLNNDFKISKNSILYLSKNKKFITIINKDITIDNRIIHKMNVYTVDGGHIFDATDIALTADTFSRTINNITKIININNRTVVNSSIIVKLTHLRPKFTINKYDTADPYIGTLDLETYDCEGVSKVYAIGFHTKNQTKCYYIDETTLDSDELIFRCLNDLVSSKYDKYTFYVHNLDGYDAYFLLGLLINSDRYDVKLSCHNSHILSMRISGLGVNTSKVKYHIKLVDSYKILSGSLDDLCRTYETKTTKGIFPYTFMKKEKLFYKGIKPAKRFYNSDVTMDLYKAEPLLWDAKLVTLAYLEKDLVSLFEIMSKFSEEIFLKYSTQVTDSSTITSIALKIYLSKYYNNNIPLINNRSIYSDIKESYYGGITEVYKPYGENLFYYDVNSLYPYAALQPMPGKNCKFITDINQDIDSLSYVFGFYYCKIVTTDSYLGLLPFRSKSGLLMANGTWEGWYFSEELKFASLNGYEINIIKGYEFNKELDVFKNYVESIYDIKMNTKNSTTKAVSKSMLNNLLGRFGLDINQTTSEIVTNEQLNLLMQTKEVQTVHKFDTLAFVSYKNMVNKNICDSMNVNHKKAVLNNLKFTNKNTEDNFKDVSIAISSAITSYARIEMAKVKLDVINNGGILYYTDTDSLVIDIPLKPEFVGKELGKFKLEHNVIRGYFISGKTYCLFTDKASGKKVSKVVIKAKGVDSSKLKEQDFKNLLKGVNVKASILKAERDLIKGYVNLKESFVGIYADVYAKRAKIFSRAKWTDTWPLNITMTDDKTIKITNRYSNTVTNSLNISNIVNKNKGVRSLSTINTPRKYSTNRRVKTKLNIKTIDTMGTNRYNNAQKALVKRAIGNFLKGVLQGKFPGINLKDYLLVKNFILSYDRSIKISYQSIHNTKYRNLPYKILVITPEIEKFVCYIQSVYPQFQKEWLLDEYTNVRKITLIKFIVSHLIKAKDIITSYYDIITYYYDKHEISLKLLYFYSLGLLVLQCYLIYYNVYLDSDSDFELDYYDSVVNVPVSNLQVFNHEDQEVDFHYLEKDLSEGEIISLPVKTDVYHNKFIDLFYKDKNMIRLPNSHKTILSDIKYYPSLFQNGSISKLVPKSNSILFLLENRYIFVDLIDHNMVNRATQSVMTMAELEALEGHVVSFNLYIDSLNSQLSTWRRNASIVILRGEDIEANNRILRNHVTELEVLNKSLMDENDILTILNEQYNTRKFHSSLGILDTSNVENKLGSGSGSERPYSPFTPSTYESLIKESKENSIKLKNYTDNLDNRILTDKESKEYKDIIEQQVYLIEQRTKNFNSLNDIYVKKIDESLLLKAKVQSMIDFNDTDPASIYIPYELGKTMEGLDECITKLMSDKKALREQFMSESFIAKPVTINVEGWDTNLGSNEKRHLKNMGVDSFNNVKERLAIENRIKANTSSYNYNKGYTEAAIRVAKEVILEVEKHLGKVKADIEIEKLIKGEDKLATEIERLENELSSYEPNNSEKGKGKEI